MGDCVHNLPDKPEFGNPFCTVLFIVSNLVEQRYYYLKSDKDHSNQESWKPVFETVRKNKMPTYRVRGWRKSLTSIKYPQQKTTDKNCNRYSIKTTPTKYFIHMAVLVPQGRIEQLVWGCVESLANLHQHI